MDANKVFRGCQQLLGCARAMMGGLGCLLLLCDGGVPAGLGSGLLGGT